MGWNRAMAAGPQHIFCVSRAFWKWITLARPFFNAFVFIYSKLILNCFKLFVLLLLRRDISYASETRTGFNSIQCRVAATFSPKFLWSREIGLYASWCAAHWSDKILLRRINSFFIYYNRDWNPISCAVVSLSPLLLVRPVRRERVMILVNLRFVKVHRRLFNWL